MLISALYVDARTMIATCDPQMSLDILETFPAGTPVLVHCGADGTKRCTVDAILVSEYSKVIRVQPKTDDDRLTPKIVGFEPDRQDVPAGSPAAATGGAGDLFRRLGLFDLAVPPSLNLYCGAAATDDAPLGRLARSTAATRRGPTGLVETVPPGRLRREWDVDGTLLGWLIEPARYNLLTHSSDFNQPVWQKTSIAVAPDGESAPDGTDGAARFVEKDAVSKSYWRRLNIAVPKANRFTYSFYTKPDPDRQGVSLYVSSQEKRCVADYDLTTGDIVLKTYGEMQAACCVRPAAGGWKRLGVTVACADFFDGLNIYSYFSDDATNGHISYTGNGRSGIAAWGSQLEAGADASSHIPTGDVRAIRAADAWSIPTADFPFTAATGAACLAARAGAAVPEPDGVQILAQYDDGTARNVLRLLRDHGRSLRCQVVAGGREVADLPLGSVEDGQAFRVAVSWSPEEIAASLDGATVLFAKLSAFPGRLTMHRVGCDAFGGGQWNGHVLQDAYFPVALQGQQLQHLTK